MIHRIQPAFFASITTKARKQWEMLEADPEIAAPWHQLFKQVQSPRHVLSELLQNAEDAGATWAKCEIKNGIFVFEHNGADFTQDTLGSLCRFGFSNKRTLHTIGFRGIGFKTIFSLGSVVTVETPSLSFCFHKGQFTLPVWRDDINPIPHTRISLPIVDTACQQAVEANLRDWLDNPVPLLFFTSIQTLQLDGIEIRKVAQEEGPVSNSRWYELQSGQTYRLLSIRSDAMELPDAAVNEIREERGDDKFTPGAAYVELVFGLKDNLLYTVLPIHVAPNLPFSCNAPFLQDPNRQRIKDPAISPTNQWLLKRIGKLASSAFRMWIGNESLSIADRVEGYGLLPAYNADCSTPLEEAVRASVRDEIAIGVKGTSCILDSEGQLRAVGDCADVPAPCVEAWGATTGIAVLGEGKPACVHPQVSEKIRNRLQAWSLLRSTKPDALKRLLQAAPTLPRPHTNIGLLALWAFLQSLLDGLPTWHWQMPDYAIIPVVGSDQLFRVRDVVRLTGRDERLEADDHDFLLRLVNVADQDFLQLFDEKQEGGPTDSNAMIRHAASLYRRLKFESSSLQRVFALACQRVFGGECQDNRQKLRLARIAVCGDLTIAGTTFQYLCRDMEWRSLSHGLIFPSDRYDDLLPDDWMSAHCLSDQYGLLFSAEERARYLTWLRSTKSAVREFPVPAYSTIHVSGHDNVRKIVAQHGGSPPDFTGAARTWTFMLHDYDWDTVLLSYWQSLARDDEGIWCRVVEASAHTWGRETAEFSKARVDRPRGAARYTVSEGLRASWLDRLQGIPCLSEDRFGRPEVPTQLLRRTPDTESLFNIEKFVHRDLDNSKTLPMLEALGVRSQPQSADKLMQRLRALSEVTNPPLTHLLDLYRALDGVLARLDTEAQDAIRREFDEEYLIFADDAGWCRRTAVFQTNDEELPGVAVIHPELRSLSLWDRLRVQRYPTLESVIDWLSSFQTGAELAVADRRRLSSILQRSPQQVLDTSRHWLSSAGTWERWSDLTYFITRENQIDTRLFKATRRKIADFRMLLPDQVGLIQEARRDLLEAIQYHVDVQNERDIATPEWARETAIGLLCIQNIASLDDVRDADIVRLQQQLAAVDLFHSRFIQAERLAVQPFLEGVQVGTEVICQALWKDQGVYTVGAESTYHRALVDQLLGRFSAREFRDAIRDCVGRSVEWIQGYFSTNYTLQPRETAERELGLYTVVNTSISKSQESAMGPEPIPVAPLADSTDEVREDVLPASDIVSTSSMYGGRPVSTGTQNGHSRVVPAVLPRTPLSIYLEREGFVFDAVCRLYTRRKDGTTVQREVGSPFWIGYNAQGEEVARYFEQRESSLRSGIVMLAEVWHIIERRSDRTVLIFANSEGHPVPINADVLIRLRDAGSLTVAVASYRLLLDERSTTLIAPGEANL